MLDWARKEVKLACEKEAATEENNALKGYGAHCYKSALRAFKKLINDRHSGFGIMITRQILNRLIDGKPLTEIEDTDDIWNLITDEKEDYKLYQCKRMSALFKYVYNDGTIKYDDINRYYCVDAYDLEGTYSLKLVGDIINELYPITMPYYPGKKMKVYCETFLTDEANGDFDTVGVFYILKPELEKIKINRFFKVGEDGWIEIKKNEFNERKKVKISCCGTEN